MKGIVFWVVAGSDKVKAVESIEVDKGRNRKGHSATDAHRATQIKHANVFGILLPIPR